MLEGVFFLISGIGSAAVGVWLLRISKRDNVPFTREDLLNCLRLGLYQPNPIGFGYFLLLIGLVNCMIGSSMIFSGK